MSVWSYYHYKFIDFFKWIPRDSIRQPRLVVNIAHVTPMPTLPSLKAWLVMTSDNHSRIPQPSSPRAFHYFELKITVQIHSCSQVVECTVGAWGPRIYKHAKLILISSELTGATFKHTVHTMATLERYKKAVQDLRILNFEMYFERLDPAEREREIYYERENKR